MMLAPLTLAAINKAIESAQEDGRRNHLGASIIGKPCERELFYDWRWTLREFFTGQELRLFERGHLEESRFIKYLQLAGIEIWPFDEKGKQWRTTGHNGHFGGSLDGVVRGLPDLPPGTPAAVSFKTHNDKSFTKLIEMGVMGSKWAHFVQEQIYMKHWRLDWSLYMAVNKNTDHWHLELLHYDAEVATNALTRGGNVIYANSPPKRISSTPGAFACKFCFYNRLCHFGDVQPDVSCRTCKFSRVAAEGLWHCGLQDVPLDGAAQRAGCGSYQVHSKLVGVQE